MRRPLWFRNGGRPAQAVRARVNRKFTRESDRSILSLIFSELSPRQSLPIYRGLLVGSFDDGNSSDVLPAALGLLARAGARAAAARQDARLGEAAADQRVGRGAGRDRGGVRHESVLQAPAGGLRGRRPGRDRDRRAGAGWRAQGLPVDHRQETGRGRKGQSAKDKKAPDHTGSIGVADAGDPRRSRDGPARYAVGR